MKDKLFKGVATITIGAFITKVIGALYRIPLGVVLKPEGLGVYQMAFPFYTIMLTLSSSGIPSGISKMIAEGKNELQVIKKSTLLFGVLGFLASVLMFAFSQKIANLQKSPSSALCLAFLSPSVFLVSIISQIRGYFQGKKNMKPTALSQIIEQVVKLVVGLSFAYFLPFSLAKKAGFCALAVTISEIIALLYLLIKYSKRKQTVAQSDQNDVTMFSIVKIVLPIMISSIIIPISHSIDSFFIVDFIGKGREIGVSQFGIYSGAAESIIAVPVAVCYGISVCALPFVASDKNNKKLVYRLIIGTFSLSLLASLTTFFMAKPITKLLYKSFSESDKELLITLLKVSSVQVIFLSLIQTTASLLIAKDRLLISPLNLFISLIIKIIFFFVLTKIKDMAIFGLAISDIIFYFVAVVLNLLYIIIDNKKRYKRELLVVKEK